MKQSWRLFVEQEDSLPNNNLNALFVILKILETACEQFSIRQAQKMERKNKQAIMQAVQPAQQPVSNLVKANQKPSAYESAADWSGRQQRAAVR